MTANKMNSYVKKRKTGYDVYVYINIYVKIYQNYYPIYKIIMEQLVQHPLNTSLLNTSRNLHLLFYNSLYYSIIQNGICAL